MSDEAPIVPAKLGGLDWGSATTHLLERGWVRFPAALDPATCLELQHAAPAEWEPEPHRIGEVEQRGLRAGCYVSRAAPVVQHLAAEIVGSVDGATALRLARVPEFNLVTWGRTEGGEGFITRHRDPPTAGGIIAVFTLIGRATFQVWDDAGKHSWETGDGDLVLLQGSGWPESDSRCPDHEASALDQGRWTMTFRHNLRGPDGVYFD